VYGSDRTHMSTLWYFGYGSNMSRAIFEGRRQMQPLATQVGWIEGYRISFDIPIGPGERGVANLEPLPGWRTHGVVYTLAAADCDRLDGTEGVPAGIYRRVPIEVVLPTGERLDAFTYRSSISQPGRKPSARYLGLLLEGARERGLPPDYVSFLEGFELAVDERQEPPDSATRA
jgi:cation transport regulator ChaC